MIKSIGKRWLSLLLVLVMLVSLMPFSAQAAAVPGVSVTNLSTDTSGGTWSNYNNSTNAIQGRVYGTDGRTCSNSTANTTTLTLRNTGSRPATLSFNYSVLFDKDSRDDSYGRLILGGTTVTNGENKTGQIETTLQPNATYVIEMRSERGNDYYGQLTIEQLKLTPFYTVRWSVNGSIVETDSVAEGSYPDYNGSQPTAPAYQGNQRSFLGWSTNPNDSGGELQPVNLGRVTGDVTFYAIFTSINIFPVTDPDVAPDQIIKNGATIDNPTRVSDDGLKLSKMLDRADDGTFNLTMEGYSTADTTLMNVTEKVPTDFIVIVDQSGSMDTRDMPLDYQMVPTSKTIEEIAAGNYYIKGDDGQYYRVYAVKDYLFRYYAPNYWYVGDLIDRFGTNLGWFMGNTESTTTFENQMYFREANAAGKGVYHPITMTVQGAALTYYIRFKYTNNAGNEVLFNREEESYVGTNCPYYHNVLNGNVIGPGWGVWPVNYNNVDGIVQGLYGNDNNYTYSEIEILGAHTGMLVNYPMYDRRVGYVELRYRDVNGVEHTVSPMSGADRAEFCNENGQAITTRDGSTRYNYNKLYQPTGTTDRLTALQAALREFARAVSNEKDTKTGKDELVDNRIAIVGFSSSGYNNNELLTGENLTISGKNGTQMNNATTTDYRTALVGAYGTGGVGTVNQKVSDAIDAITANGGTQPEYGFQMAKSILDNRTNKTYTMVTGDKETVDRNTIVIFFTDGQPGDYAYSNMYSEANDVVEAAQLVKNAGAQVFSIGVFGESDGNPLTYNANNDYTYDNQGNRVRVSSLNRGYWEYLGGWVETHQSGGSYYCLRRQWRPDNVDYTPVANDTIFDYMSVVSSNYPSATDYIAQAWLNGNFSGNYIAATEGVRGASVDGNQFYRMASNQATLITAFTQAVTHASTISTSSSSVVLNTTSVFKDTINTVDFDVENATYTVYKQAIHVNESATPSMIESGALTEIQAARPVPADGKIEYSGFDYQANYVSYGHPDGYKLVVKVDGLEIRTYGTEVKSNADTNSLNACGIYEYGKTEPAISIQSPRVTALKPSSTYIADFNAPLIVATDVDAGGIQNATDHNGTFTRTDDGKAVYKLSSGTQQSAGGTIVAINVNYTQADSAKITGKHAEDGANAFKQPRDVIVLPAGSVYYDDDLTTPIAIGDGSGYNAAVQVSPAAQDLAKGVHTFTFYGTGIDVYCTTNADAGYIQVMLDGALVDTMLNQSETVRYNVPSVSLRDLTPNVEHTLKINVLGSSYYKLDGIRVYNPMADQTQYAETDEQYATFINLREVIINNGLSSSDPVSVTEVAEDDYSAVFGALFVDNMNKLSTRVQAVDAETGEPRVDENDQPIMVDAYNDLFEAYQANSPKNEVYLGLNQAVTFRLTEAAQSGKLWIGLSAPDAGAGTGRVMVNSRYPITVRSGVDMYYEIDPEWIVDGSLTIANDSMTMISVTNLKITGVESIFNAAKTAKAQPGLSMAALAEVVPMVFEPVTIKTVRMALNGGFDPAEQFIPDEPETPDEPDPTPTPDPTPSPEPTPDPTEQPAQNWLSQLISNFVSSIFRSIARLFGN